jgi:hypothetical protein
MLYTLFVIAYNKQICTKGIETGIKTIKYYIKEIQAFGNTRSSPYVHNAMGANLQFEVISTYFMFREQNADLRYQTHETEQRW